MTSAARTVPESKMTPGSAKVSSAPGNTTTAASSQQQVNLFQELFRYRDLQFAKMLTETRNWASMADEMDMELVFAMDRADFAETQLKRLLESAPQTYRVQAQRVAEFQKSFEFVSQQFQLEEDNSEKQARIAWVLSRLRLLQPLCQLSEKMSGADADVALGPLLWRCEEKLLTTCTDASLEQTVAEFNSASLLSGFWSLINGDGANDSQQDQWLPQASTSPTKSAEPEKQLHREIEALTDRNEKLRRELQEETVRHRSYEAQARGAGDNESGTIKEIEALKWSNQKLMEEAAELQNEVTRLQAGLPQLESQAAPLRLQLSCERSTVASHREEIAKCRSAIPAILQKLRKYHTPSASAEKRLASLSMIRRELAEAYAALSAMEAPEHVAANPSSTAEELAKLERRFEVAKAVNVSMKVAMEARNGSAPGQANSLESRNLLIAKVAKNSKEIADLKERLRREELVEERMRRQESRTNIVAEGAALPKASPAQSSRSSQGSGSHIASTDRISPTGVPMATVASAPEGAANYAWPMAGPSRTAASVSHTPLSIQLKAALDDRAPPRHIQSKESPWR